MALNSDDDEPEFKMPEINVDVENIDGMDDIKNLIDDLK
jgi:hypothetical protein